MIETLRIYTDAPIPEFQAMSSDGIEVLKYPKRAKGSYLSGTFVPHENWQSFHDIHHIKSFSEVAQRTFENVCVSHLDDYVLTEFYRRYLLEKSEDSLDDTILLNDVILPQIIDLVVESLSARLHVKLEVISSVFQVGCHILHSTKVSKEENIFGRSVTRTMKPPFFLRGLHVDNWENPRRKLNDRRLAALKIGINFGIHSRSLLFIDQPLNELMRRLVEKGALGNRATEKLKTSDIAAQLAEFYMLTFPESPVRRISLNPGAFYLAPVQNCIHDGGFDRASGVDINLMISIKNPLQD